MLGIRSVFLTFAASLALFVGQPGSARAGEFAVVDVQKVMESQKHWKEAVAVLEKERTGRQTSLEAKQKELKDRKDKLDAAKAVSAPNATATEEEALIRDAQALTQQYMMSQQELTAIEKKATDQMLTRVEQLVREIALESDYSYVLEMGAKEQPNVLFVVKSADITDKVIKLYDKYFKDKALELK